MSVNRLLDSSPPGICMNLPALSEPAYDPAVRHGEDKTRLDSAALIDSVLLVYDGEEVARAINGFRRAEHQVTAGVKREVQHFHYAALGGAVEVDEEVSARRQAEVRKRRGFDDVMNREKHSLPDLPPHAITRSLFDEVAAEVFGRQVSRVADGVTDIARIPPPAPRH